MIVPSIDLMDGKAVKLVQGNPNNNKFEVDALKLARKFSIYPEINLIDLDAAFGKGDNIQLIQKICKICNCNVGGGIRTVEKAYQILKAGANKLIIGTNANKEFLSKLPKEKIIVAVDSKKGKIVDKGWTSIKKVTPDEKVMQLEEYCSGFLYTYVDKEGTLDGIDIETVLRLRQLTNNKIIYAGGISNQDQILQLANYRVDAVIGMAYYKKKIDLIDTIVALLDFEKNKGLIPTIVRNEKNQILMLAFSNQPSVLKALKQRKGIYYSRTRKELWEKGETSGNTQKLLRVNVDCDNDTLIYTVQQKNYACHTGQYSCFNVEEFGFDTLLDIVKSRKGAGSYTDELLNDKKLLKEKILEEAKEVVNFKDRENLQWEIADLLYFVSVLMIRNNLDFDDILKELQTRNQMQNYIKTTKLR